MEDRFQQDPQTEVDVRHLMGVFSDLLPDGRLVGHGQIEAAITVSRTDARYRTVVRKWRKELLDERGVFLDGLSANGQGFVALTPDEMVRHGNRGVRMAGRKLTRALMVMSVPADVALSEEMRRYRGRLSVAVESIARQNKAALREVTRALAPMPTLPRRVAG
jgi:hypothetical protein